MATGISVLWQRSCLVTRKNMPVMCGAFTTCDWLAHTKATKKNFCNFQKTVQSKQSHIGRYSSNWSCFPITYGPGILAVVWISRFSRDRDDGRVPELGLAQRRAHLLRQLKTIAEQESEFWFFRFEFQTEFSVDFFSLPFFKKVSPYTLPGYDLMTHSSRLLGGRRRR
jgi:hypothetical protein